MRDQRAGSGEMSSCSNVYLCSLGWNLNRATVLFWSEMGRSGVLQGQPVILVVEDDQQLQSVVEDALTEGGFEAAIAQSGEEAVTLLRGRQIGYRALVTDINLRGSM